MKVIGAVGQNGSGKDEVLKYLKAKYGVPFFSTGDMVREIAAQKGLEPTRENLQGISERYFHEQGEGCFVRLLAERMRQDKTPVVGISGIRSLVDVQILREVFGKAFCLIQVSVSDPRLRYERMVKRAEERDPQGYRGMSNSCFRTRTKRLSFMLAKQRQKRTMPSATTGPWLTCIRSLMNW
jgi:dephospho-CoA kinase